MTVVAFGGQPLPLRAARREKTEIVSARAWWCGGRREEREGGGCVKAEVPGPPRQSPGPHRRGGYV